MSNLYPTSPVKVPCSAYSVSMDLVIAVNFWDAGPEAIGEDMHMYLKCYFSTAGRVIVKSIFSPASQCNIEGTGTGVSGYISGMTARYTQSKRHLWGTLDFGYVIRRTILSYLAPDTQCTVYLKNGSVTKSDHEDDDFQIWGIFTMFHRMFEAHIFMGQFLTLVLVSNIIIPSSVDFFPGLNLYFWSFISSTPPHWAVITALHSGYYLRLLCMLPSIMTFYYYEKYHDWVGFGRWERQALHLRTLSLHPSSTTSDIDMKLLPKLPQLGIRPRLSSRRSWVHMFDWAMTPISGFMFYVIPQYHAQLSHLVTDRLEYCVAAKPIMEYVKGDEGYFEGDTSDDGFKSG